MTEKKITHVVEQFLLDAPPGEYEQCSYDLSILTNKNSLKAARASTHEKWLHKFCYGVNINGNIAILCDEAKVSDGVYLNPNDYTLFKFNYDDLKATPISDKPKESSSSQRNEMQKQLQKYAKTAYKSQVGIGVYEQSKGNFTIVIRSSSISLNNYRTGGIVSRYTLDKSGKLKGEINIVQHFFESGNVMCNTGATLSHDIHHNDIKELIATIEKFEAEWLKAYYDALEKMYSEGMNKLRRKLPYSGTKINWEAELCGIAGMSQ
ncbi:F-actin-capping protein subunit alpha [Histomonas meleagridis]|uniref:F-actin-capping protein subunit alpha n=1 Tax=Histomonas meleagridis TaxID=135588 RepID=UPI00355A26CB|nr:F-actin-capping protein subunit alpha [Histomonas meleagridis]KAH0796179.1 F-actin-capping protein subunit alpha [Histomonas meleagridis]